QEQLSSPTLPAVPDDLGPQVVGDGLLPVAVRGRAAEPEHGARVGGDLLGPPGPGFGRADAVVVPAVLPAGAAVGGRPGAAAVARRDAQPYEVAVGAGGASARVGLHRDHRRHRPGTNLLAPGPAAGAASVCTHTPSTHGAVPM